jgi:hypothetical protein
MERPRTLRTTSSASLENYKAAQEEGCWPDPGCGLVFWFGSFGCFGVVGGLVCALTHIPNADEVSAFGPSKAIVTSDFMYEQAG